MVYLPFDTKSLFMKKLPIYFACLLLLVSASWATLTNESVVKMIQAGLEEDTIVSVIEKDESNFDLSVDGLIALKEAGVSENLIQVMLDASGKGETESTASVSSGEMKKEMGAMESIAPPFIDPQPGGEYYTRYTFYYERNAFRSTNYRRGTPVPINTKVKLLSMGAEEYLISVKGETITVKNNYKHSGCSVEEFASKMLSEEPTDIDALGKGLAADIKYGSLRLGMTKEQAIMARGYPPVHETASIEMDRWVYWSSRFVKLTIVFYDGILSEGRGIR